jgi:transcriptional regulator with XRE-family HTH domain
MTIREELASTISHFKEGHNLTYKEMIKKTGLNKTQLIRITCKEGDGVSIDLMEKVCKDLGYLVELEVI